MHLISIKSRRNGLLSCLFFWAEFLPFTQTSSPLLGGDAKVAFSLWWAVGVGSPCSHR